MRWLAGLTIALALPVATAEAWVAPGAKIVSASLELREQGDEASGNAAISADGRYVVFDTQARNLFPPTFADPPGAHWQGGVMRRDLTTGALELVAPGDLVGNLGGGVQQRGARNPSVSADGRVVAFSTAQKLVPEDVNGNIDVYVRDMVTGAYELISVRDGGSAPASYAARDPDTPGRNPGADVSPGVSLSADGDRVLFRTVDIASDLPARAGTDTEPYQLLVRERSTRRTELITRVAATGEPAGGARNGGALSADGSTVAWPGANAGAQTRFLDGEFPDPAAAYYLWRRVDDGGTRRITGPAEPELPGCSTYDPSPSTRGPCSGPLSEFEQSVAGINGTLPALSADGRRVLFLTSAPPRPPTPGYALDLWMTDMRDGLSRTAASVELTREGSNRDPADASSITAVALSPDGRWAGVLTQRTRFLLPALRLVNTPTTVPGAEELYLVDLDGRTVERAVRGANGAAAAASTLGPVSLSDGGHRITFGSNAENLFFGDANQRADVFVIDRLDAAPPVPDAPEPPAEPPAEVFDPPTPQVARLRVVIRKAPGGRVRLRVRAPGRGRLAVEVRGRVPDRDGRLRGSAKLLGKARKTVRRAGDVTIDVRLAKRYDAVTRREKKLDGRASVVFTPASGAPRQGAANVRFSAPPKRK
ncbi:PD40 domain-containing protein [Solirubrobacter sp. CPCC 204708]|uniref:PD40 domain-containing protein n=1 Tax=Solirubrobacter deserti TaxID=2282478 RepID=A0ABT4RTR1_9ACTN|nr:PD40 domain-containing protein [Solirubrobacter deserti]MBE2320028.1 PD40 domain-containing protein [Solirubrobacter deserti]MDA0141972.1 PD40 domain-containing protein [Solirubrobacter deserti]